MLLITHASSLMPHPSCLIPHASSLMPHHSCLYFFDQSASRFSPFVVSCCRSVPSTRIR
jgi:hypothetical protein